MAHLRALICVPVLLLLLSGFLSHAEGQTASLVLNITSPVKYAAPKFLKQNAPNTIVLGVLAVTDPPVSRFGNQLLAIKLAIDWVNKNPDLLPNTAIEMYSAPSIEASDVLLSSFYLATTTKVHGFIGAGYTPQSKQMQTVSTIYQIPQLSASVVTNALSNKDSYPLFARTVCTDTAQINGIIKFFQDNGWKQGVVVYTTDEYGGGYSPLVLAASQANISLYSVPVDAAATNTAAVYKNDMDNLKALSDERGYRIFVLYTSQATTAIVSAMNISGLYGPGYVLIETGGPADGARTPTKTVNPLMNGVFGFGYGMPSGPVYEELLAYWKSQNVTQNDVASYNLWYYMDIVLAYAHAYDNLLKSGMAFNKITGKILFSQILNQTFIGTTGEVKLDKSGDRIGAYEVWNWIGNMTVPAGLRHVGHFDVLTQTYTKLDNYTFFGNSQVVPPDRPFVCPCRNGGTCSEEGKCVCLPNYSGTFCDIFTEKSDNKTTIIITVVVVVVVVAVILILVVWLYRKNRRQLVRSVAEKQKSIIPRYDLVLGDRIGRGASGEVCKGLFRGTEIAVKRIITSNVSKDVIEAFELEVAVMCGLRHPNIIMFMGSCYDPTTQEMLLCMEFMGRGSLNDVIHNPNMTLSYEMKLHLAAQAAQGMNFLHQSTPPTIHRDLKSHNILLDDKWNARISDFGISKFKEDAHTAKGEESGAGNMVGTIYWTAPEVLDGKEATEKSDCYAFGIVLWELFHNDTPYSGRDPMSVAIDVIRGLRPSIDLSMPPKMETLMKACWAQDPKERPTFQEVMTTLRTLSMSAPLVDYGGSVRMDAPTGHVYLVKTTIPNAYNLWEAIPRDMEEAIKLHNQVTRHNLGLYKGYEVSYYDHSFTAAFASIEDAINFAIAVQISLLHVEWPAALLEQPLGREVQEEHNTVIWKGLRVRMAIGSGVPNCEIDAATNRMQYFGSLVDHITKMLELSIDGGILLNESISGELEHKKPELIQKAALRRTGTVGGTVVNQVLIEPLAGRCRKESNVQALPHAVISVDDLEEEILPSPRSISLQPLTAGVKWVTPSSSFDIRDVIGKGHIGDYYRGTWKGQEVALKVLVNQKLKENDMLKLIGDSAYMSKLQHPNLLPFHAVCLEPEKLTIISEYGVKGSLKNMLADPSIQITLARKIKIALDIAQGMAFLTSLPDEAMSKHDNLKSGNVIICKNDEVKIADHGHSNIKELARTMTSVGNVAWTAPEVLSGQHGTASMAIYSFGIILWELYTRQIPYKGHHPIRVVTQILGGYRPPLPSDCPPLYQQLYQQCVDGEPDKRPSWNEIMSSLNRMASST